MDWQAIRALLAFICFKIGPQSIIALVALIFSIVALIITWIYNRKYFSLAERNQHTQMLLQIDDIYIEHPELWAIIDTHPLAATKASDPLSVARRNTLIARFINMFDIVFGFYDSLSYKNNFNKLEWESWDRYIREFFNLSSEARELFMNCQYDNCQENYSVKFVAYINKIIAEISPNGAQ